ncbi:hypothetical protein D3C80_1913170 [compost metagenome]
MAVDAALDHGWRYHQRAFVDRGAQLYRHQLAGPEQPILVVEFGLDPQRASAG